MTCLVTGATGFLGTNLVRGLVDAGWEVRASGMPGSKTTYLDDLPIEIDLADITDPADVSRIVRGCEIVFHAAGDVSNWRRRRQVQRLIHVGGTLNVAEACLLHGVRRMVHTSTIDVLGHDASRRMITEGTGHFNYDHLGYHYGESKHEAETLLRAYESERDLDLVVIYPGFMSGPFAFTHGLDSVLFSLRDGSLPGAPPGGSSFCHVTEVARAEIAAAERGRRGEGYICAGHNRTYQEWFTLMAAAIDARPLTRVLPEWLWVAVGWASEAASAVTGEAPMVSPGFAHYVSRFQYMDSTKAQTELGYVIPPPKAIIGDAVAWYRAHGYDL